jgi:hypothetical protein
MDNLDLGFVAAVSPVHCHVGMPWPWGPTRQADEMAG